MLHSDSAQGHDTKTFMLADDHPLVRRDVRPAARRALEIDGGQWRSQKDFYDALSDLLGGVERNCRSSGAFLETMIFYPELNVEQPPYEVVITNPPAELRPLLFDFACGIAEARQDRSANPRWGDDVEVVVTVA
jgi:hypothetical protein